MIARPSKHARPSVRVRPSVHAHPALHAPVTLRLAREEDRQALRHLAELDSAATPEAPVMVAEADGALLAAVSVVSGAAVADPFAPTAHLLELLRLRVRHLRAEDGARSLSGRRRRSPQQLLARVAALVGTGEERRAAAYGVSGSQALVARSLEMPVVERDRRGETR